jgi:hypothetical protein
MKLGLSLILTIIVCASCSTAVKKQLVVKSAKVSRSIASINEKFIKNVKREYTIGKIDFKPLPYEYKHFLVCVKDNKDGTYMARFGYENFEEIPFLVDQGSDNKLAPVFHINEKFPVTVFNTGKDFNAFEVDNILNENQVDWKLGRGIATSNSDFKTKCD